MRLQLRAKGMALRLSIRPLLTFTVLRELNSLRSDQEQARCNWMGGSVVVFPDLPGDAALQQRVRGTRHQRVAVGNAGQERTTQRAGEQSMQIGMQYPAGIEAVIG